MSRLSTWSMKKLLENVKNLTRTDYGGRDAQEVILADLMGAHPGVAVIPRPVLDALVQRAAEREWNQVRGCRERHTQTLDEISERLFGREKTDS